MSTTSTHPRRVRIRRIGTTVLTVVAAGLLASGCSGSASGTDVGSPARTDHPAVTAPDQSSTPVGGREVPDATGDTAPAPSGPRAWAVRADQPLVAFAAPDVAAPQRTVPATTEHGSPTALLVTDQRAGWVQVLVPGRPTGATGWLRRDGLRLQPVTTEIHVDLATRTLTLLEDGEVVLTTPVAVGAPATPTPTGRFSVTDKLDTQDANGPYGRYAIGLSGRSEVLTEFAGGDGQIGIHGTNQPASIGQAVSHGCIRVPNDVMDTINHVLPLGTPVVVS